ncbi:uncharacterized protein TNCV_649031 [Trichonephila clavipes]|nr:uncharacterized protein TNCV_649031 [Trichonephila clavipes]
MHWPLAKVIWLIPGKDGKIRTVELKTRTGTMLRSIQRVYPLEVQSTETLNDLLNDCTITNPISSISSDNLSDPNDSSNVLPRVSKSTEKSLNDVRSQVKGVYQSNSAITDVDVTFDDTWLTWGHSSKIDVGCVIDLLTGFVMDFEIMSKRCNECEHAKSGLRENSEEFHLWYEGHISSCAINYIGSSCVPEQEATFLNHGKDLKIMVFDT